MEYGLVLAALSALVIILGRSTERAITAERAFVRSILHGNRSVHHRGACDQCDRPIVVATTSTARPGRQPAHHHKEAA